MKQFIEYINSQDQELTEVIESMIAEEMAADNNELEINESKMGDKKKELMGNLDDKLMGAFYKAAGIDTAKVDKIVEKIMNKNAVAESAKFGLKMMICGAAVAVNEKGQSDLKGIPALCNAIIATTTKNKQSIWTAIMSNEIKNSLKQKKENKEDLLS